MNMVVYTLEQRWKVGLRSAYRRCRSIIFSDEAHFDLGWYVNKQNCCIWGTGNPHAGEEDISNISFQQDGATWNTAEAALDVLHPVLKIVLSAAELMSFSHLGAAI